MKKLFEIINNWEPMRTENNPENILECQGLLSELHKHGYRVQHVNGSSLKNMKKGQKLTKETIKYTVTKVFKKSKDVVYKADYISLSFKLATPPQEDAMVGDDWETDIKFSYSPIRYNTIQIFRGDGNDIKILEIVDPSTNTPVAWALDYFPIQDLGQSKICYDKPQI